jgi:hypothetical protein
MTEQEEKLLEALAYMARQYLDTYPDGTVDSYAMSAGERAILALVDYGLMENATGERGRILGRWTHAGNRVLKITR